MKNEKLVGVVYLVIIFGLFLYSFTQVDLSLTFSKNEFLKSLVTAFQQIGYFNRPFSTYLYVALLIALFGFYAFFLRLAHKKKITKKFTWTVLLCTTGLLAFSYNAFSYDLFNYIFDAKIITHYQQNPYEHKALDYAGDPMLSFMRWTHRVYPYGPVWLGITVPLSFIGFQFFLPTFFLFKMLMSASFIGSLYVMGKIFQKIAPEKEAFGLLFFGLNPLVLIESLVSAHLDIVMIFFCLWAFYLLIREKYLFSLVMLLISIGIKFATGFLVPIYLAVIYLQQKHKNIAWNKIVMFSIFLMIVAVVIASVRTTFQPWYLVLVLAFAAFLSYRYYIIIPSFIISFGALLTYVPYLYVGNWDPPIPAGLTVMYLISLGISFVVCLAFLMIGKFRKQKH